ncbi:hypothetical protein BJX68DRAFT_193932 [Aspergillus pseudodeflectus]|uniref:Uncharacterized protein n=1 Tax=Aspergillus pseudodeflectus TaxID=176178 RepID=A0ABR4KXE3_9EURO
MVISFGFGPVSPDISGMVKRPTPRESLGGKLGRPGLKSQHPQRLLGRLREHCCSGHGYFEKICMALTVRLKIIADQGRSPVKKEEEWDSVCGEFSALTSANVTSEFTIPDQA